MYILGIKFDKVVISYHTAGHAGLVNREIASLSDFDEFLKSEADKAGVTVCELDIMHSSTMDFPRESTHNADTLALVAAITNYPA